MTQCPFPQVDRDTRHFVPLTGIFWVEIEYKFFSLMVYDKSFGIVSHELMFSILRDCTMNQYCWWPAVLRGSLYPVQLISHMIIPPMGEGGGATQQRFMWLCTTSRLLTHLSLKELVVFVQGWILPIKISMSLNSLYDPFSNQTFYRKSNFLE